MKPIITSTVVAVSLSLCSWAPTLLAHEKGEEEKEMKMSDVPAAVQKTFNTEAKGGTIVRVEQEGANFEAVIAKNGKQTGVEVSSDGKVVSRHNEKKEHKEKGERGEKY